MKNKWTFDFLQHTAIHPNGTQITFDGDEVVNISHMPSSVGVGQIRALLDEAKVAYQDARQSGSTPELKSKPAIKIKRSKLSLNKR